MKKSFWLFLYFFIAFVLLTIVASFAYLLYYDCTQFSASGTMELFHFPILAKGFAFSLPFAAILACLYTIFCMIRRESNPYLNLGIYVFLCALTWILIIPLSFKLSDKITVDEESNSKRNFITANYFRPTKPLETQNDNETEESGTVYFTSVDEENFSANGVFLGKNEIVAFKNKSLYDFFAPNKETGNIQDPLFLSTLKPGGFMDYFDGTVNTFSNVARYSYMGRGLYLIALFSLALAIHSVIGFSHCSKWRLCNACIVIMLVFVVCFLNYGIYTSAASNAVVAFFMRKNVNFLANRLTLAIIVNGIFFIAAVITGIVTMIKNPDANKENGEAISVIDTEMEAAQK